MDTSGAKGSSRNNTAAGIERSAGGISLVILVNIIEVVAVAKVPGMLGQE